MDKIIALYANLELANQARIRLFADNFAADRVDVVSWAQSGRVVDDPGKDRAGNLSAYFTALFSEDGDTRQVDALVQALRAGKATVVVHPRGTVEITRAREILESHKPENVIWRVAPLEAQGGLLGEHAAG